MPGRIYRACAKCAQPFTPKGPRHRHCDRCRARFEASPTTRTRPSSSTERERIRKQVLARDPTCTIGLPGCTVTSTVAHHLRDAADGGAYTLDNLAGACHECNSALGGRRAHQSSHAEQAREGGAAPLNVGGSGGQPPLYQRLR